LALSFVAHEHGAMAQWKNTAAPRALRLLKWTSNRTDIPFTNSLLLPTPPQLPLALRDQAPQLPLVAPAHFCEDARQQTDKTKSQMHGLLALVLQVQVAAQAQCYVCGIPGAASLKYADPLARAIHGRIARTQG